MSKGNGKVPKKLFWDKDLNKMIGNPTAINGVTLSHSYLKKL